MTRAGNKMILVSIIMPVYNSEKYVEHAVNCLLEQTEKNIEVILVDDGSTDASRKICDRIAERDSRVKVIHQKNAGICAARNAGLKSARGEYVTFCDNDDEVLPDLVKDNYELAHKYNADVVRYCRRWVLSNEGKVIRDSVMNNFPFLVITASEFVKYEKEITNTGNGVWTGLYKKEFLEKHGINFDEMIRFGHEDTMFNLKVYQNYGKMILNPKVYYLWLNRLEHSTTGKFNINYIDAMKRCLDEELKLNQKYGYNASRTGNYQLRIVKTYVYSIYDYLNKAKQKLSFREKRKILADFRKHPAFKVKNNSQQIQKDGLFFWGLWTLFYYRFLTIPYILIHLKQRLFNS